MNDEPFLPVAVTRRIEAPAPEIFSGQARTTPGLVAKLSINLSSVCADTYCRGTTETPYPGSGLLGVASMWPAPTASPTGVRR